MGIFMVYRVEAPSGKILQAYTATDAHRTFGDADLPKWVENNEDL